MPTAVRLILIASLCSLIRCGSPKSEGVPLFTKGVYPLVFTAADFPLHPKTGQPMQSSADCQACHEIPFKNWNASRHKVALTNELYKESHAREPSPWCVNCHAPLRLSGTEKNPYRGEEGVSCLVCHARGGAILTGALPAAKPGKGFSHRYRIDPQFKDERLCENCHDFNFPTAASAMSEGKDFHYTDQAMQSTTEEYRQSAFYGKVTCQGCHVFPGTKESHSFPGGHAIDRLRKDLRLEVVRSDAEHVTVRIFAQGIGHAFPTGDLFRTLRIRLIDPQGRSTRELELRHYFVPVPQNQRTLASPLKVRVRDETLPPPQLDYISLREYVVPWPAKSRRINTELYIDYLAQVNTMTTRLPAEITRPLIKRESHRLFREAQSPN